MKLLNYTSLRYLLFTALLMLISIPIFYISLNKIFVSSIDKDLRQQANDIPSFLNAIQSERDLQLWKTLDNDLDIVPADSSQFLSHPFTIKKRNKDNNEDENFRILQKKVDILGKQYIINIESSLIEKDELIKTILIIQLGLLFLLLLGAVVLNYFINRKIWKPFYDCLHLLQQFNIEITNIDIPKQLKIQEFEQLNQSIHRLTTSVQKAYFSQKEFIENASHELQTPLTIFKFKIELLLQDKQLTENQSFLITDMYKEIEQMEELNNNLLLLSKIQNGQFTNTDTVDLISVTKEVIDELSLIIESKSQQIIEDYPTSNIILQCNRMLLKILIKNLLLNAIQYSNIASLISISISENKMVINNPGEPLEIPQDKLFKRFIKNNSQKGNGLGLSIVKTIAEASNYKIIYLYQNKSHSFILEWNGK